MGICFSDPAAEELLQAGLEKQSRLFDRDIRGLGLMNMDVDKLYRPFASIDSSGDGKVTEAKWNNFFLRNIKEQKGKAAKQAAMLAAAKAKVENAKASPAGSKNGKVAPKSSLTLAEREAIEKAEKAAAEEAARAVAEEAAASALPRRKYARRLFHTFSRAGRGEMDFGEFLVSCIEYLMPLHWSVIHFAFSVYDTDGGGTLQLKPGSTGLSFLPGAHPLVEGVKGKGKAKSSVAAAAAAAPTIPLSAVSGAGGEVNAMEILYLAKEIAMAMPDDRGKKFAKQVQSDLVMLAQSKFIPPHRIEGAISAYETRHIDEDEFGRFALQHPAVLYPVLRLQQAMRLRLGGDWTFDWIAGRKLLSTNGKFSFLSVARKWQKSVIKGVQVAKRRGEDAVPHAICTLSDDVRKPEDLAPELDWRYYAIQYQDCFGPVRDLRRDPNEGAAEASRATQASSSSTSRRSSALKRMSSTKDKGGGSLGKSKRNLLADGGGDRTSTRSVASSASLGSIPPSSARVAPASSASGSGSLSKMGKSSRALG